MRIDIEAKLRYTSLCLGTMLGCTYAHELVAKGYSWKTHVEVHGELKGRFDCVHV